MHIVTSNSQEPKREITAAENAFGPLKDLGPLTADHRHALQRTQGPETTVIRRPRFRSTDSDRRITPNGSAPSNRAATTATIAVDHTSSGTSTGVDRNHDLPVLLGRAREALHRAEIEAETVKRQALPATAAEI